MAELFSDGLDIKLEMASIKLLGQTGSITITIGDMIFFNKQGDMNSLAARCEQLCWLINDPSGVERDRTKLQERPAELSGGYAVIKVGDASTVEVGDKTDDALNTTLAIVLSLLLKNTSFTTAELHLSTHLSL